MANHLLEDDEMIQEVVVERKQAEEAAPPTPAVSKDGWTQKEVDYLRVRAAAQIAGVLAQNPALQTEAVIAQAVNITNQLVKIIVGKQPLKLAVLGNNESIDLGNTKRQSRVTIT